MAALRRYYVSGGTDMARTSRKAKPRRIGAQGNSTARDGAALHCPAPVALMVVEGVNFSATLFDTNDISTIRGSSLALLRMADSVAESLLPMATASHTLTVLTRGASVFELAIDGQEDAALPALLDALLARARAVVSGFITSPEGGRIDLARFTILTSVARADELPSDAPRTLTALIAFARSRLRIEQARTRSFAMPHPGDLPDWAVSRAAGDCAAKSGLRGVVVDERGHGAERFTEHVSAGVLERRQFGRAARRGIWIRLLADAGETALVERIHAERIDFADQLRHLLPREGLDPITALSPAIRGKIALIHLDGNGFGGKRALLKDAASHGAFSDLLRGMQARLIAAVIGDALTEGGNGARLWADGDVRRVRIEPLLLGGDEMVVAVPAFCALPLLALMQCHLAGELSPDWVHEPMDADKRRLTHAAGIVLADQKTPIRHLRDAASALVDLVKAAQDGRKGFATAILAMEGFALPHGGIDPVLRTHYDVKEGTPTADAVTFPAGVGQAPWPAQLALLCELRDRLAISQAIKLLRAAGDVADWEQHVVAELNRLRMEPAARTRVQALLREHCLGWHPDRPTTPLRHYLLLHDYLPDVCATAALPGHGQVAA